MQTDKSPSAKQARILLGIGYDEKLDHWTKRALKLLKAAILHVQHTQGDGSVIRVADYLLNPDRTWQQKLEDMATGINPQAIQTALQTLRYQLKGATTHEYES